MRRVTRKNEDARQLEQKAIISLYNLNLIF